MYIIRFLELRHRLGIAMVALGVGATVSAHHSYSMFDASRMQTVTGTVAKLDYNNPHVFVWLYVPKADSPGKYDLYAFENGSINTLSRLGWSATALKPGEKITVDYWPLKDGRPGGHYNKGTLANGRVLLGAGGPGEARAGGGRAEFELPKADQKP